MQVAWGQLEKESVAASDSWWHQGSFWMQLMQLYHKYSVAKNNKETKII